MYDGGLEDVSSAKDETHHARRSDGRLRECLYLVVQVKSSASITLALYRLLESVTSTYLVLLYTDRSGRDIAAYEVTQDERTAEGTARIFVEQYIPLWGCPHTLLSDNGSEFVARLSLAIYKLMRIRKIATTAFHPKSNGGVERVNHSLAQIISLIISEQQDDWDEWLPYVVQAYNNSVTVATGLAPNEIHLGRMPRLPMTIIDECVVKGKTRTNCCISTLFGKGNNAPSN